jgi:hypothetical protein
VQARLVELMAPDRASDGTFGRFKHALEYYDQNVGSFAYDIMSMDADPERVKGFARAYVESGKYRAIASIFLSRQLTFDVAIHRGHGFVFHRPSRDVIDTSTRTHGCFADYIRVGGEGKDIFGFIDGKGVFLYATRGATTHVKQLLASNGLAIDDIDLLIEHQANFAMIPATLEQVFNDGREDVKGDVARFIAHNMVTNIHERGNCSVVCMQRLPYDLDRGALKQDMIQGFVVNENLDELRKAKTVLYDSVGAGMTRSSFLVRS